MNFLQRNQWLLPILFVIGFLSVFGGALYLTGAMNDAFTTTEERICASYKKDLADLEHAMTVCYNDPFCRLSSADFAEHQSLTVLTPRVCAGLRPILPQAPPPESFLFPMPNPGTTALNRAWCPPGSLPTTHGACVRVEE